MDAETFGGQAGTSSLIRNYLGFSRGISGQELAAQAYTQAWLFGASFDFARHATGLRRAEDGFLVSLSDGIEVRGRSVLIATGVSYRRLGVPALEPLQGAGVFYSAAVTEAQATEGREVHVVGGGNSAGQAAMHLSRYASKVVLLVRGIARGKYVRVPDNRDRSGREYRGPSQHPSRRWQERDGWSISSSRIPPPVLWIRSPLQPCSCS